MVISKHKIVVLMMTSWTHATQCSHANAFQQFILTMFVETRAVTRGQLLAWTTVSSIRLAQRPCLQLWAVSLGMGVFLKVPSPWYRSRPDGRRLAPWVGCTETGTWPVRVACNTHFSNDTDDNTTRWPFTQEVTRLLMSCPSHAQGA